MHVHNQMPSDFPTSPGHRTPTSTCSPVHIPKAPPHMCLSSSHQSFSVTSSPAFSLSQFVLPLVLWPPLPGVDILPDNCYLLPVYDLPVMLICICLLAFSRQHWFGNIIFLRPVLPQWLRSHALHIPLLFRNSSRTYVMGVFYISWCMHGCM